MNRRTLLHACGSLTLVLAIASCQDETAPSTTGAVHAPSAQLGGDGGGPPGIVIYSCAPVGEDVELCTMNADGSGQTQITDNVVGDFSGDLSTNGNRIVFSRSSDVEPPPSLSSLYRMRLDGSGLKRLTFDEAFDFEATWSPDGKQIVFARVTPDFFGDADLTLINADGSGLHDLVSRFEYDVDPAWSPDGKQIAFASNFGSQNGLFDVRIIRADGTSERNLTKTPDIDEYQPAWSPDGRQVAYGGNGQIHVSNDRGNNKRQLTADQAFNAGPVWSRNGKSIYYVKDMGQGIFDIFVMNADGSGQTNLTKTPNINEFHVHVR
jgi:Tol biopolymer transport system component